jgi:hypothetical protein
MTPSQRLLENTNFKGQLNEYVSTEDEPIKATKNKFFSSRSSALAEKPKSSLFDE